MRKISLVSSFILLLLMVVFGCYVNLTVPKPQMEEQDIYYSYVEGSRLVDGENPYARVLESDMRRNKKYATYFPVFYELSYLSQLWGLDSFETWMPFWNLVFMIFEFELAALFYLVLAQQKLEWAGVFAAAFWLFNRWTLAMIATQNMDFIPIFLLVLSLLLFPRRQSLSLFLFSLSLGFKQIAIFLLPLYLIWVFRAGGSDKLKQLTKAMAIIASVPFISALPFLAWNAEGFIKSVLFSATRTGSSLGGISVDAVLGWDGLPARIIMLALMFLVYLLAFRGDSRRYLLCFFVMAVFVAFNTVLFIQYFVWLVPLLLLLLCEFLGKPENRAEGA